MVWNVLNEAGNFGLRTWFLTFLFRGPRMNMSPGLKGGKNGGKLETGKGECAGKKSTWAEKER